MHLSSFFPFHSNLALAHLFVCCFLSCFLAAISAADVKALRTATGAGMMDCKKALKECGGDGEKAQEVRNRTHYLGRKGVS